MSSVKRFEDSVLRLEGFRIRILRRSDGRDVRSDAGTLATYDFVRRARGDWTVAHYVTKRLAKPLAGFRVSVVDPAGRTVNGRTKLRNLRASYGE